MPIHKGSTIATSLTTDTMTKSVICSAMISATNEISTSRRTKVAKDSAIVIPSISSQSSAIEGALDIKRQSETSTFATIADSTAKSNSNAAANILTQTLSRISGNVVKATLKRTHASTQTISNIPNEGAIKITIMIAILFLLSVSVAKTKHINIICSRTIKNMPRHGLISQKPYLYLYCKQRNATLQLMYQILNPQELLQESIQGSVGIRYEPLIHGFSYYIRSKLANSDTSVYDEGVLEYSAWQSFKLPYLCFSLI